MHATGGGFQRGVQGKRAVAVIFEAVALGAARRKRQDWIEPIQSLNGSLLIDAENRCMLRRVQIQADDVSRLALEIRIVAGHVPLQTMRFHAGLFPDTMDSILADTQLYRQLAAAPVGGTLC